MERSRFIPSVDYSGEYEKRDQNDGGLRVLPEISINELDLENTKLLILPRGTAWNKSFHDEILHIAGECIERKILVAAICGATLGLANKGLLNLRRHTSNSLDFLKMFCPLYSGQEFYEEKAAMNDQGVITASGIAPLDFTYLVMKEMDLIEERTLEAWFQLYKTGNKRYLDKLTEQQENHVNAEE